MIFLRILSIIAGGFALLGSPFFLLGKYTSGPTLLILAAAVTVLLFASIYFFFGVLGHRVARSARLRVLAAGLIAFQRPGRAVCKNAGRGRRLVAGGLA